MLPDDADEENEADAADEADVAGDTDATDEADDADAADDADTAGDTDATDEADDAVFNPLVETLKSGVIATLDVLAALEQGFAEGEEGSFIGITPMGGVIVTPTGSSYDAPRYGQISLVKFKSTANGMMGGMALDTSGGVWVWGYNLYGELGVGGTVPPGNYYGGMKRVPYFKNNGIFVIEIGASYETRYALGSNGIVYAWGHGSNGAMGNGTSTATNYTPAPVPGLSNVAHIYVSKSYIGEASIFALTHDGQLYAWGNNGRGMLGVGVATTRTTPTLVTLPAELAARNIVHIACGANSSFILDDEGDLWTAGGNGNGEQARGTTGGANNLTFVKFNRTAYNIGPIKDVDVGYTNLAINGNDRIVICDATDAYEWGDCYDGTGTTGVTKNTPAKIVVAADEIAKWGYTPIPQAVYGGGRVAFFIDQYGRPWAWGYAVYHGFGQEGGYTDTLYRRIPFNAARQYPDIIGDGDSQTSNTSAKYPVYYENRPSYFPPGTTKVSNAQRGYGFNSLHPTIYDEKYMLHDADGNVLSVDGVPLKYATAATVDGVGGLTTGMYYESTGGVGTANRIISPAKKGTPAIDPTDWLWIRLAFLPVPFVSSMDIQLSNYMFIDADGNLFKWGYDGSGSIAWGWDYDSRYDSNGNLTNGLYDRYLYEVMYMRGAPTIDTISVWAEIEKKVYAAAGTPAVNPINVTVHMPKSMHSSTLESNVYSDLNSLKYVIIPYDTADPNFNLSTATLTEAQFMALYDAADASMKGELLTTTLHSGATPQDLPFTINAPVNGRIIIFGDNERYASVDGGITREYVNHDPQIVSIIVDNVYTTTNMLHQGEGTDPNGDIEEVYAPTSDNVRKTNDDSADTKEAVRPDLYGMPLDAYGNLIDSPRYGYDDVVIASYELAGYPVGSDILKYWKWKEYIGATPQPMSVSFNLDDNSYAIGYTHTFFYEPNDNWTRASGTKYWDDQSDKYELRPASIELTLKQYARDETTGAKGTFIRDVKTITVTGTGDAWDFDFGWFKSLEYTYEIVETEIAFYKYPPTIVYTNLVVGPTSPEDFTGVSITNTLNLKPILFFKIDASGQAITVDFAEFTLTNVAVGGKVLDESGARQDSITIQTDTTNGRLVLPLQLPGTYRLTEVKAPSGYNLLTKSIIIVINNDSTITATLGEEPGDPSLVEVALTGTDAETYACAFNIPNKAAAELPGAKGSGVIALLSIEALLISITTLLLLGRRRRVIEDG